MRSWIVSVCSATILALGTGAFGSTAPKVQSEVQLLQALRGMPGLYARYRETKHISLLLHPLVSEGTIHYAAPDRLVRHQHTPTRSTVLIEAGVLQFTDGERQKHLNLADNPSVRGFVDTFRRVLSGDGQGLRALYDITVLGDRNGWILELSPRPQSDLAWAKVIRVEGQGNRVTQLRIDETGGDYTEIEFFDVDPLRSYSKTELRRIFRLPP